MDILKTVFFMYGHWITIIMVFTAGLGGVSLFALGYIILAFWILWQGTSLYIMPDYRITLRRWNLLLYYTVFVMFCKVSLQVIKFYVFFEFKQEYDLIIQTTRCIPFFVVLKLVIMMQLLIFEVYQMLRINSTSEINVYDFCVKDYYHDIDIDVFVSMLVSLSAVITLLLTYGWVDEAKL